MKPNKSQSEKEKILDNIDKEIDEINSKLIAIKIALKVIRNET